MSSVAGITNVDHARCQRHAVSELAAIMAAHAGLRVIACTAGPAGGPVPAGVRAAFAAWQDALGLDGVLGTGGDGGAAAWLRARAWRGGARVGVTVFAGDGQDQRAVTT